MGKAVLGFDWADPVLAAEHLGQVHFIGIGGSGMSAIARVMLGRRMAVSGSDAKDVPVLAELAKLGAQVAVGFDVARVMAADTVVVGSAIRDDNPEYQAARELGKHVIHRSQALQGVMAGRRGIAVAGTNGKSSTAAMITHTVTAAGVDPSYAIGAPVVSSGVNGGYGPGDVFVAEACESDRSFVVYRPSVSVITNVQPDHLDFYGTFESVQDAFDEFTARLGEDGVLVACADDDGAAETARRHVARGGTVVRYGTGEGCDVLVSGLEYVRGLPRFTLTEAGSEPVTVALQVPGGHNVLNAAAAFAAARAVGVSVQNCVAGLESFPGAVRRFELVGTSGGVRLYDDYAHNPAKVAAAVATAQQTAGDGTLVVVFQPHLYSRTRDFAVEFGRALAVADHVVVMDVYGAREEPMPGVTGELVWEHIPERDDRKVFVADRREVVDHVVGLVGPGDVVVTIGAGDVNGVLCDVAARLAEGGGGAE